VKSSRHILWSALCWLIVPALAPAQTVVDEGSTWVSDGQPFRIHPEWHSTDFAHAVTPTFTFTVDVPVLTRTNAGDQIIVFDNAMQPLFNASDLTLSTEGAIRLDLIFYDESGWDLEFAYLGTEDFSANKTLEGDELVPLFFNTVPAEPADEYQVLYETNLASLEFNLRRRCGPHVSLLAGIRAVQLHEAFDIMTVNSGGLGVYSKSYNHLWGAQIGGDFRWWLNGVVALSASLKAGAYNNKIQVYANAINAQVDDNVEYYHDTDEVAFLGEAMVGIIISMGHRAALRLGYMAIITDGIAVGPDQSGSLDMFNSIGEVHVTGPQYHGGYGGFEFTW
jgi:hypothetical protein